LAATGERVSKNEAVFREVNERIRELSERLRAEAASDSASFVCECSAVECHETVELTLAEYEQVRAEPTHFLAAPGHLWSPELETEVRRTERFIVLEKRGAAEEQAVKLDPRPDER
jgi:hypothetical protein